MRCSAAGMPTSFRRSSARLRASARRQRQVGLDGLDQLAADRIERIEAGQRVLEDGADPRAAHLAHLLVGQLVDAPSFEPDLAGGDAARRLEQADDGIAGQRLAGARFAHHAQDLAGRDVERHVVDREQRAAPRREFDAQVLDLEQRRIVGGRGHQRSFGLRASRSQSPSRFTASTRAASVIAGKHGDPPFARLQQLVAETDQRAERRLRRRQADAQKRQRRLGDDGEAQIDGGDHQHRTGDVGQHVTDHDQERRQPDHARGLHVFLVLLDHHRAAHRARILHPEGEADGADDDEDRDFVVALHRDQAAHDAVDQQRHQDRRER